MPTRREFLGAPPTPVAALPVADTCQLAAQQGEQLPASIRALSSMKGQARPITVAERQARVDRARELLSSEKLDALLLMGGTSLRYFANMDWGLSERMLALVVPATGRAFVVCPAFEKDRAAEQIDAGP